MCKLQLYISGPSAAPISIAESAVDSRTLVVYWAPPPMESQNGIIIEYVVNISSLEIAEQFQHRTTGDMSSLNIGGLHPDYTYTSAGTGIGRGPFSTFHSIRMPEDGNYILICCPIYIYCIQHPLVLHLTLLEVPPTPLL